MVLSEKAKKYLNILLDKEEKMYTEAFLRWEELDPIIQLGIQNMDDFHLGYVFGSIELKFVRWHYSEFGVSQSDEEYKEFWNICKSRLKSLKTNKKQQ